MKKAADSNAQNMARKAEEIRLELLKRAGRCCRQVSVQEKERLPEPAPSYEKNPSPDAQSIARRAVEISQELLKNRETVTNQPRKEERPPEPAPSNEKRPVPVTKAPAALYELASSYESSNAKEQAALTYKKILAANLKDKEAKKQAGCTFKR